MEQDEYSVHGILGKIMNDVSDENFSKSAFVGYSFNRPLPSKKELKKNLINILKIHKSKIHEEKEVKVSSYRHNYSEWWLAVVDYIGYGVTDLDVEQFYDLDKLDYQFDRILIVSPLDVGSYRFLYE